MNATSVQAINFRDPSCNECRIGCRSHPHGARFVYVTSSSHARNGEIWFHRYDLYTGECSCEFGQMHPRRRHEHTGRASWVAAQANMLHEVRVVDSIGAELFSDGVGAPKAPAKRELRLEDFYAA